MNVNPLRDFAPNLKNKMPKLAAHLCLPLYKDSSLPRGVPIKQSL